MATNTIPCKRPKVTVSPIYRGDDSFDPVSHDADCHVPGCTWTYPADKQFMALKSDAEGQATMHRAEHRAAVPYVEILDLGVYTVVTCVCGHQHRVQGNKTAVAEHVTYHLSHDHGLVTCS